MVDAKLLARSGEGVEDEAGKFRLIVDIRNFPREFNLFPVDIRETRTILVFFAIMLCSITLSVESGSPKGLEFRVASRRIELRELGVKTDEANKTQHHKSDRAEWVGGLTGGRNVIEVVKVR